MSTIFSHSVREHGSQMRSGHVFFMGSFQVQVNIMYPPRHRRIGMSHKQSETKIKKGGKSEMERMLREVLQ